MRLWSKRRKNAEFYQYSFYLVDYDPFVLPRQVGHVDVELRSRYWYPAGKTESACRRRCSTRSKLKVDSP